MSFTGMRHQHAHVLYSTETTDMIWLGASSNSSGREEMAGYQLPLAGKQKACGKMQQIQQSFDQNKRPEEISTSPSECRTHAGRLGQSHTNPRRQIASDPSRQFPCDDEEKGMCLLLATINPSMRPRRCRTRASHSCSTRRSLQRRRACRSTLRIPYSFEQREGCLYLASTNLSMSPIRCRIHAGLAYTILIQSAVSQLLRRHRACRWSL
mmetsp:Transcript_60788/g.91763  ORF Transcript_60788/g.91763 Transcript_60788/m.91763 type:complete len:210 (-) Transcript_60788:98-727(-)